MSHITVDTYHVFVSGSCSEDKHCYLNIGNINEKLKFVYKII